MKRLIYFLIIFLVCSDFALSRVYLPKERFFTAANCTPRTFCSILKDYVLTEPQLIRDVIQPYKRLKEEYKILTESNDLSMNIFLNSNYAESREILTGQLMTEWLYKMKSRRRILLIFGG